MYEHIQTRTIDTKLADERVKDGMKTTDLEAIEDAL